MGDHLLNFWTWLLNAAQQAAIAEAPAVMTAAGHKINRSTGKVEYNHANDKGVKQLRSNLSTIGEAGVSAPGIAEAVELGYNVVRHPKLAYDFLKNVATRKWVYKIPENSSMAYRIMGPLERDWILQGNELSTRATNAAAEAEAKAVRAANKGRFLLFKAGADHGGRKLFAKGLPWKSTTTTHGEKQYLAIPGENLPWVSGRHYNGPHGYSFSAGEIPFEEAPFGSHIDLLTDEAGFSGVNPSLIDGSVIYSPFNLFGRNFGYKLLKPGK